jgi:hypothetical protein
MFAKNYYRNAPYDWVAAVLKFYDQADNFLEHYNDAATKHWLVKETVGAYTISPVRWYAPVGE